ncbi:ABC-type nitrate/sulfonate/bicarbonate transport system permease component [Bradyrhizobium sp. JR7.2]
MLGIGELSKITMVIYSCAWPLLRNTIAAVKQGRSVADQVGADHGCNPAAAVPQGDRSSGASDHLRRYSPGQCAILVLVASEMVGAKAGLGYLIIKSQYSFLIAQMYFGILGITVIGLAFNAVLKALERRFMRWKAPVTA